jgi:hypothetical protein
MGAVTLPASAAAQQPVSVGVAAGATPTATGRQLAHGTGAHAQLAVERARVLGRLGVRVDAFVHGFRRATAGGDLSSRAAVPGAAASLVWPLAGVAAPVRPYLLAGAGTYRTRLGVGGPEWHFGLSGGGGVEVGRGPLRPFAETRLHQVYDGGTPRLVPVAVGLRF